MNGISGKRGEIGRVRVDSEVGITPRSDLSPDLLSESPKLINLTDTFLLVKEGPD